MEQRINTENNGKIRIPLSRNVLIFLVIVAISTFFWFLFVLSHKHTVDITVKIEYQNTPKSYVLTNSLPNYVVVSVNDLGFNELANFWRKEDTLAIEIDLAGRFDSASTQFSILQSELHKSLAGVLPSTADIKQFYPKEISVGYKRLYQKRVPVRLVCSVNLSRQFTLKNPVSFSPDTISIFGPKDVISDISEIKTVGVKLNNVNKSQRINAELARPKYITTDPKTVNVNIDVEQFTEKSVTVPIQALNTQNGKRLRTFPSEVTLTFNVGLSRYKQVTADDFEVFADVSNNDSTNICILKESHKLPFVSSVRMTPDRAEYIIEDK
ncbi:MAG: YbbR-like domain-containing protein [Paludibacteraceae bacterium]|nr:YbbR-like domain-containing protein [Paludibacteraceae bacterium]